MNFGRLWITIAKGIAGVVFAAGILVAGVKTPVFAVENSAQESIVSADSTKLQDAVSKKNLGIGYLKGDGISISKVASVTYNGLEQTPKVTITDSRRTFGYYTLTEDVDYTLTYKDNIHAGTASVTAHGIGNYEGYITASFVINPRKLHLYAQQNSSQYGSAIEVLTWGYSSGNSVFENGKINPELAYSTSDNSRFASEEDVKAVKLSLSTNAETFAPTSDYALKNYTISISYVENQDYTITATDARYYLKSADMFEIVSEGYEGDYDGQPHTIFASAKSPAGYDMYAEGSVYYLYSATATENPLNANNCFKIGSLEAPTFVNPGTYTVYYVIVADFYNTVYGSEQVVIHRLSQNVFAQGYSCVYDGFAHFPEVKVTGTDDVEPIFTCISDTSGTYESGDVFTGAVFPGTYKVRVEVPEGAGYAACSTTATITVEPKELIVQAGSDEKVYDGTELVCTESLVFSETDSASLNGLAAGDVVAKLNCEGSILHAGTAVNRIITAQEDEQNGFSIVNETTGRDVTFCYSVKYLDGELTVSPRSLKDVSEGSTGAYASGIWVSMPENETYNGQTHTPLLTIRDEEVVGAASVEEGETPILEALLSDGSNLSTCDYVLSYEENIDAGLAVIVITGMNDYCGEIRRMFTIAPAQLSGISLIPDNFPYRSGVVNAPEYYVKAGLVQNGMSCSKILTPTVDYTIVFENEEGRIPEAEEVGTYTVTAYGKGNYTGSVSAVFTVDAE